MKKLHNFQINQTILTYFQIFLKTIYKTNQSVMFLHFLNMLISIRRLGGNDKTRINYCPILFIQSLSLQKSKISFLCVNNRNFCLQDILGACEISKLVLNCSRNINLFTMNGAVKFKKGKIFTYLLFFPQLLNFHISK